MKKEIIFTIFFIILVLIGNALKASEGEIIQNFLILSPVAKEDKNIISVVGPTKMYLIHASVYRTETSIRFTSLSGESAVMTVGTSKEVVLSQGEDVVIPASMVKLDNDFQKIDGENKDVVFSIRFIGFDKNNNIGHFRVTIKEP